MKKSHIAVLLILLFVFFISCDGTEDAPASGTVTVENRGSSPVTVFYAFEDSEKKISQRTAQIAAGASELLDMQCSIFTDGLFSARNSAGAYHTYESDASGTVIISDGDF